MRKSIAIGQCRGIPLQIHINWFLIAALVTWSLAAGYFPQQHPGWTAEAYWMVGITTSFLFFLSVLSHELGHALVAQREGVPVKSITLFLFGGIAHIAHEPETAGSEFRIVAAGPLVSSVLAIFFYFLGRVVSIHADINGAALYLSQINLLLAAFNLLPGFPLDGGRILRSILWKWKGDFLLATRWATYTGLSMAVLLVVTGLLLLQFRNYFNGLWIAIIGWYLTTASWSSYRQLKVEQAEAHHYLEKAPKSPDLAEQPLAHQGQPPGIQIPMTSHMEAPAGVLSTTLPFLGRTKPPWKVLDGSGSRRIIGCKKL